MIHLRRILCPVDFSEFSRHALEHAAVLATWYEAELIALHARPVLPPVAARPGIGAVDVGTAATDTLARDLREFVASATDGTKVETEVRPGAAAAVILAGAAERGADLVVLGTHGRSGLGRVVLGSVTEKVLRKATCPVLTVPQRAPHAPERPLFERILCGVDLEEASLRALAFAFSLAQEAGGRVTLLHVLDEALPTAWFTEHPHPDVAQYRRSLATEARRRLEGLVPAGMRDWCEAETRLACGKAYVEILRAAEDTRSDLVALGVHGRGPLGRMLFGSTAQEVVRQAPCPVLTVRP